MKLLSSLVSAGIFVTYVSLFCQAVPPRELSGLTWNRRRSTDEGLKGTGEGKDNPEKLVLNEEKKDTLNTGIANINTDGTEEEYEDFEDDDEDEDLITLSDSLVSNINSIMHLHRNKGEILVPCFGMWWPVGGNTGGGVIYDYATDPGVDYYDDYRRRRRRARKQKKAARMKKKRAKAKS